jgi:hypothetical protein
MTCNDVYPFIHSCISTYLMDERWIIYLHLLLGYTGNERTAVIVISAFYLPPKSLLNYQQVIPQLFFYILSILDKLVVDDYVIVYLHSGAPRNSIPGIQWFHRFYKMVDRRYINCR